MTTVQIQIPKKLRPVFTGEADVRGSYGGRGSAKTRTFAKMSAVRAYMWANEGREGIILCGRQFMESLADSSLEEIKAAIQSEPWLENFFDIGEQYVRTKCGRISYKFTGLARNINSVKSKARILLCWVDEAETVSEEAWVKLIPTLREEVSELWVTWNPEDKNSATHKRFRAVRDSRMHVVEMNWRDNPWFPSILERVRLKDKKERPFSYNHIWEGGFLEEAEGALWKREQLDAAYIEDLPALKRIVIAIDPATTNKEKSDETGIVACGLGFDNRGYVIADESGRYSPADWAKKAIELYHRFKADRIVAEVNQGGDMVRNTIEVIEPNLPITTVHASRGKFARAEPVAALYEQGKVSHIKGLEQLEDQLVSWEPLSGKGSPDRLDALVWGMTDLMLQAKNEVLKTDVSELELKAMAMPDHWPRCYAMDVTDDQITVLWAAWNIAIGQLIVYADYQKKAPEPALVGNIIKARGGWMSGLYCTDKADPRVEYKPYSTQGMKLRPVKNDFSVGIGNLKQLIAQDQIKISTEAQSSLADLKNLRTDEKGGLDMKASPYVKCLTALVLSGRKQAKTKPTTPRLGGQMARNNKSIGGY